MFLYPPGIPCQNTALPKLMFLKGIMFPRKHLNVFIVIYYMDFPRFCSIFHSCTALPSKKRRGKQALKME